MMQALLLLTIAATANAGSQLFLKMAAMRHLGLNATSYASYWRLVASWHFLAGVFLFVISLAIYIYLISIYDLVLIFPAMSLTYVGVVYLSWRILGEQIDYWRLIGAAFIAAGIAALAVGSD
jgi:drug/metabolite transporter (DMT)-like permease